MLWQISGNGVNIERQRLLAKTLLPAYFLYFKNMNNMQESCNNILFLKIDVDLRQVEVYNVMEMQLNFNYR